MASGPIPKRVTCPLCGGPTGMPCRDPVTFKPVARPHAERQAAADLWYVTKSPDGLTPKRRDEMVEELGSYFDGRDVGKRMERITRAKDPEAEFRRLTNG